MKRDLSKCTLIVQNGLNGETKVYSDFFEFSSFIQEEILSNICLPLLYDCERVNISIGCKN